MVNVTLKIYTFSEPVFSDRVGKTGKFLNFQLQALRPHENILLKKKLSQKEELTKVESLKLRQEACETLYEQPLSAATRT
ncbi:MAG: hypothetical protein KME27_01065 [Lyngbya sp. HA4199-MV5]|jgi:hypothetical protein|nr:hypothetical protein [Lyngbya sp. HA4199-MV5]